MQSINDQLAQLKFIYASHLERVGLPTKLWQAYLNAQENQQFLRAKHLLDTLISLLKLHYQCEVGLIETLTDIKQSLSPSANEKINEIVINFGGTGCIPYTNGFAHDDFLLTRLQNNANCITLNVPGVGVGNDGQLSSSHIPSGRGISDRIQQAIDFLIQHRAILENSKVKLTILGHSRGAVEALVLGKLLNELGFNEENTDTLLIAHDPVVGGDTEDPACLHEAVCLDHKNKVSLRKILDDETRALPGYLKVFLRANDRRVRHFRLLNIENAYNTTDKANKECLVLSGYHNLGVTSASSSTAEIYIFWRAFEWLLQLFSIGANQHGTIIDAKRDAIKSQLHQQYKQCIHDAYKNPEKSCMPHTLKAAFDFCSAISANPAYHHILTDNDNTRAIPECLQQQNLDAFHQIACQLTVEQSQRFETALQHANEKNYDAYNQALHQCDLKDLFQLYALIEQGLECSANNKKHNTHWSIAHSTWALTKERHFFRKEHGRTKRWQNALQNIKLRLIEEYPNANVTEKEAIEAIVSQHNGRMYSFGMQTSSLKQFNKRHPR